MRQTAVQWLKNELNEKCDIIGNESYITYILEQAKEMEKSQIKDAYETSHISMMTSEQYYNETFKTK